MAPTEEQILSTYLLSAASLHSILTLDQFAKLFPAKYQSHEQVRSLYRDLQHQRGLIAAAVRQNIDIEAKEGQKLCREVVRRRRREERREFAASHGGVDGEEELEREVEVAVCLCLRRDVRKLQIGKLRN
jgi:hypothetical protein